MRLKLANGTFDWTKENKHFFFFTPAAWFLIFSTESEEGDENDNSNSTDKSGGSGILLLLCVIVIYYYQWLNPTSTFPTSPTVWMTDQAYDCWASFQQSTTDVFSGVVATYIWSSPGHWAQTVLRAQMVTLYIKIKASLPLVNKKKKKSLAINPS